ncbi:hypothetical protein ACH50O_11660 [Methylomonas sp. 2BW1-5-20]|uniref:hypothetical protein n=1 Tax=Methylomonas sp. 2BW1-5-20 TaxID=3376686 RepID=UPI004051BDAA
MSNLKFRHFVGSDLNQQNIAVYGDDQDNRILILEKSGSEAGRITMTAEEYRYLRDEWSEDGKLQDDDVQITSSALDWFYENRPIGAQYGNTNAQIADQPATSQLQIRCTPAEKALWVHASSGEKLSEWVRSTLNAAANRK